MKTKDLIAELTTRSEIRIIFTIPYETDFTLIGTTDIDHQDLVEKLVCSPEEQDYLLELASTYLKTSVTAEDVVATYSGVRPLYNDAASSATATTRDYLLKLDKNCWSTNVKTSLAGKLRPTANWQNRPCSRFRTTPRRWGKLGQQGSLCPETIFQWAGWMISSSC